MKKIFEYLKRYFNWGTFLLVLSALGGTITYIITGEVAGAIWAGLTLFTVICNRIGEMSYERHIAQLKEELRQKDSDNPVTQYWKKAAQCYKEAYEKTSDNFYEVCDRYKELCNSVDKLGVKAKKLLNETDSGTRRPADSYSEDDIARIKMEMSSVRRDVETEIDKDTEIIPHF
jgi:hypothetical protein